MNENPRIRLVTRTDDAASCSEANRAIAACADAGTVRCVSVMAVGPALEEAASLLAHRSDIEVGLHVSLNSEWETIKWGPVAPLAQVSSLVNEDGHFLPLPPDLKAKGFELAEAMVEIAAQLQRLRAVGFRPTYLDEHCGVSWINPDFPAALDAFAAQEGLLRVRSVRGLPGNGNDLVARVNVAPPGDYVFVTHPGLDEPEGIMRHFHLAGEPDDGTIARERAAESQLLCTPELGQTLEQAGVQPVTYSSILAQ